MLHIYTVTDFIELSMGEVDYTFVCGVSQDELKLSIHIDKGGFWDVLNQLIYRNIYKYIFFWRM